MYIAPGDDDEAEDEHEHSTYEDGEGMTHDDGPYDGF